MATILIAERDIPIRCLLEVLAERLGHEATVWQRDRASERALRYDLAIIEPNDAEGLAIAREFRSNSPNAGLIFYSCAPSTSPTRELDPALHLMKPAPVGDIESAITAALADLPAHGLGAGVLLD